MLSYFASQAGISRKCFIIGDCPTLTPQRPFEPEVPLWNSNCFPSYFSVILFHHTFPSYFSIILFHHTFPSHFLNIQSDPALTDQRKWSVKAGLSVIFAVVYYINPKSVSTKNLRMQCEKLSKLVRYCGVRLYIQRPQLRITQVSTKYFNCLP